MAKIVPHNPSNKSLLYFAKYIYLRFSNGKPLSYDEQFELYNVYRDWAETVGYDYYHKILFGREIQKFGFTVTKAYHSKSHNSRSFFEPNVEELRAIALMLEESPIDTSIHFATIGGQKYKVTTTYSLAKSTI